MTGEELVLQYQRGRRNFRGEDLTEVCLVGAVLVGADFRRAILTGADLTRANIRECNFRRANLVRAKLVHCRAGRRSRTVWIRVVLLMVLAPLLAFVLNSMFLTTEDPVRRSVFARTLRWWVVTISLLTPGLFLALYRRRSLDRTIIGLAAGLGLLVFACFPEWIAEAVSLWQPMVAAGILAIGAASLFASALWISTASLEGEDTDLRGFGRAVLCWGGTSFRDAQLDRADLSGAEVPCTNFYRASLLQTCFADCQGLDRAHFGGKVFSDEIFWYLRIRQVLALLSRGRQAQTDYRGITAPGACLRGLDLTATDLSEADLRLVAAEGTPFVGALLQKTRLKGAQLAGAVLADADLEEADLRNADLTKADLRGASLKMANLEGATLAGALFNQRTAERSGWSAGRLLDLKGQGLRNEEERDASADGPPPTPALSSDEIEERERMIALAFQEMLSAATKNKGRRFEILVRQIFESIPGFEITERVHMLGGEVDLIIKSRSPDPVWQRYGDRFAVECKNERDPFGIRELHIFRGKMVTDGLKLGFVVARSGFAKTVWGNLPDKTTLIVPIRPEEFREMCSPRSDRGKILLHCHTIASMVTISAQHRDAARKRG